MIIIIYEQDMSAIEAKLFDLLKDDLIFPESRCHLNAGGEILRCHKELGNVLNIWEIMLSKCYSLCGSFNTSIQIIKYVHQSYIKQILNSVCS